MSRAKLIENIINNFQVVKNKISTTMAEESRGGITNSQWFVLYLIEKHDKISVKAISESLCISSPASTQLINALVKDGYVMRAASANDKRQLDLKLSAKGRKKIAEMKKRHVATAKGFFKALSDKELGQLLALQNKMIKP